MTGAERVVGGGALRPIFSAIDGVTVARWLGPEQAVVIMTDEIAAALGRAHPELTIEPDLQHRPAGR